MVSGDEVRDWGGGSVAAALATLPGADVANTSITQSSIVARGFNNVFSGALLVLVDHKLARLPSLRFNAYNMIPTTMLDVERVEFVLGPAAALYGPNSGSGVMHIITSSPIDRAGTRISLSGGERDVFHGMLRHATRFSEAVGLRLSGQYFRGEDWNFTDPVEEASKDPQDPLIGNRDFGTERFSADARLDLRPWGDGEGEIVFHGGMNQISGLELTAVGAGQLRDWRYTFGQARLQKGGLFAQAYMNQTDSGDTYLLRTGAPIEINNDGKVEVAGAQTTFVLKQFTRSLGAGVTPIRISASGVTAGQNQQRRGFAGRITVEVRPISACSATPYGVGCLAGAKLSGRMTWDHQMQLQMQQAQGNMPAVLAVGTRQINVPLPTVVLGCMLHTDVLAVVFTRTTAGGLASVTVPIPKNLKATANAQMFTVRQPFPGFWDIRSTNGLQVTCK